MIALSKNAATTKYIRFQATPLLLTPRPDTTSDAR